MPRKPYPEHLVLALPDAIYLCQRCKGALVYTPHGSRPECQRCGDSGRPGELFLRAEWLFALVPELRAQLLQPDGRLTTEEKL
jgi:hypothetical protein